MLATGRLTYASDNTVQTFTQSNSSTAYTRNTAQVIDTNSVDGVVGWTRWGNGTITYSGISDTLSGGKYLQAAWGVPATNYPTSGLVNYALASASAPTRSDGTGGDGTFTGNLAVDFAALKVGIDSTVTVGGASYQMATAGGTVAPSMVVNVTGNAEFQPLWFSGTTATINSVTGVIRGLLAGPGANYAALSYKLIGGGVSIIGAATFKNSATTSGTTSGTGAGTGTGTTTTPAAGSGAPIGAPLQARVVGLPFDFVSGAAAVNATFSTPNAAINGPVNGISDGQLHEILTPVAGLTQGTATIAEYSSAGDVLGWSRWSGGTVVRADGTKVDIPANGGVGVVWGAPVTNMPTTGTVNYKWIEGTSPVNYQGSAGPGYIVDANLVVAFGAASKAGLNANIMFNGTAYNVASAGGTASPSMAVSSTGSFAETTTAQTISGFLAGPGAGYAGLSYTLAAPGVSGTLTFRKGP